MKNKKTLYCLIILFTVLFITIFCFNYFGDTEEVEYHTISTNEEQNIITKLQREYNNKDIIALLEIPNVLSVPIVKTKDNDFYLNHNLNGKKDKYGAIFMDYRNNLTDKKLLIYGHNINSKKTTFTKLTNYSNYSYYKKHPAFYIYTKNRKIKYNIFSSYIENIDFDYVNLKSFNGLNWNDHLQKLKNKSFYDTEVLLDKNSKIVILQTCSYDTNYDGNVKYQLVMGVEG